MKNNLIFDLGFLNGEDSQTYLERGFTVVAVEANPRLYSIARSNFANQIRNGHLTLRNMALSESSNNTISFFISKTRPEVSSTEKWIAEQDGSKAEEVLVGTTDLKELFDNFGTPHYMKVDVEGMDRVLSKQLLLLTDRLPEYVSFELNKNDYVDIFMNLKKCGYKSFQLRNQINNKPNCSGDFGEYLDKDKWIDFNTAVDRYLRYRELKIIDNINLGVGWLDLHAKLS